MRNSIPQLNGLGCIRGFQSQTAMMSAMKPSLDKRIATPLQLALTCHQQGKLQEAFGMYQQVLGIDPNNFDALQGLGLLCGRLGRFEEALHYLHSACLSRSYDFLSHYNLGVALQALGRYDEALVRYETTLKLKPGFVEGHINRGNVLKELGRYDEALASYDKAITRDRASAKAYNNRGAVLEILGRFDEALASYEKAIAFSSSFAQAHNNRGALLEKFRRYNDALASYNKAIALSPNDAEAHYNKGLLLMSLGDDEHGRPLYEWRWNTDQKAFFRNFKQPLWLGNSPLVGCTVLLHAEQGIGDTLQMARYVPMVEALGANVVLEVPGILVPLLKTLEGNFTLVARGDALPAFDLQCPLMSLPLAFKTRIDSIPAPIPYLAADPDKQQTWRERLGTKIRPRVGLAWSGDPRHKNDRNRSMNLRILEPLLHSDCEFHVLQKEIRTEDRTVLSQITHIHDHTAELKDFADTAALIAELDLVITVDTSVAHLAGAMGKTVWILLPFPSDHRWLTTGSDSPWYPTAKLFRQHSIANWESVREKVLIALKDFLAACRT